MVSIWMDYYLRWTDGVVAQWLKYFKTSFYLFSSFSSLHTYLSSHISQNHNTNFSSTLFLFHHFYDHACVMPTHSHSQTGVNEHTVAPTSPLARDQHTHTHTEKQKSVLLPQAAVIPLSLPPSLPRLPPPPRQHLRATRPFRSTKVAHEVTSAASDALW